MNLRQDFRILALLVAVLGAFQVLPLAIAVAFGESPWPWLASIAGLALPGLLVARLARPADRTLRARDAYLVVAAGWLLASIAGALPYGILGVLGPADAFFESVSGFTTTGATAMTKIEGTPAALLFWRSLTQWLGGMGIILFAVAVLPLLGIGGMQLFRVEVPGPVKDKLRPRVIETARRLWAIYVGLTLLQWIALMIAGMSAFDAINHAFTTLATGGFSTRDASIGAYHSPAIEWIVIVFMTLAGVNFVLHYRAITEGLRTAASDSELHYYAGMLVVASLVVLLVLPAEHAGGFEEGVRNAVFGVVSVATTTGFGTVDFERWPPLAQLVLLQLMILGGMAGSTAGGVKSLRALIGFRALRASIEKLVHPRAVRPVKYNGRAVPEDVVAGIWAFLTAYFAIAVLAAAVVAAAGYDLVTAASASLTTLGNVGPGLGQVGPFDNFSHMPAHVKVVLSFSMLAGRLEVFTFLVLLQPGFWRR